MKKNVKYITLIIALITMLCACGNSSNDIIIGNWDCIMAGEEGDFVPIPMGSYAEFNKDNSFLLYLDNKLNYTGSWERMDSAENDTIMWKLTFDGEEDLPCIAGMQSDGSTLVIGLGNLGFIFTKTVNDSSTN